VNHHSPAWEPEPFRWLGINGALAVVSSADSTELHTGRPARRAGAITRFTGG
jgi:hypothetical protein